LAGFAIDNFADLNFVSELISKSSTSTPVNKSEILSMSLPPKWSASPASALTTFFQTKSKHLS